MRLDLTPVDLWLYFWIIGRDHWCHDIRRGKLNR